MNSFFRWGMIPALLVIVACGVIAFRIVFVEDADVAVPEVVGMSILDAADKLQQIGLLAKVDKVESAQPAGMVISQHIEPGMRVGRGKVVLLKVSRGGERTQIPDVRGREYGEAVKLLSEAGFSVESALRVTDPLAPAGRVIAQNPAFPAAVGGVRSVKLLISEGDEGSTGLLFVPNLAGQSVELAKNILSQSKLSLDQIKTEPTNDVAEGLVISTTPRAGARVPVGAPITLSIARKPNADEDPVVINSADESTDPVVVSPDKPTPPRPNPKPPVPPKPDSDETLPTPSAKKVAKIRYQVPPLTKALTLKIELVDVNGSRTLKDSLVNGSEYITLDAPFVGEARVLIQLGGELVWQDKFE